MRPVDRDVIAQILRDHDDLRPPGTDLELEAVRAAILLEDVFGITLSEDEIDPAVLADSRAMAVLVARLLGTA
jgi:hypothetical protein